MEVKTAINREIFTPHDEKMLVAVQVKRRTKKKIPFLATGGQGDYSTFICISKTKKKPFHVSITKVKKFEGSMAFVRRSQWSIAQLRQVNGIDPNRDSPEFDLTFDTAFDQWVASSCGEKGIFVQVLHTTCQQNCSERKPEFVNCQAHLLRADDQSVSSASKVFVRCQIYLRKKGVRLKKEVVSEAGRLLSAGNSILHTAADSVTSAVQKASQALNERGERLGRTEEKTSEMMNSAQQFADTAHKLAMKHKC
ncbi:syntaxin-binding protein 6 isoform X1 [Alosa sapidissima]|uniref:syntaxin-binding protein 6 isoform X1 n=1 Tax=Alosa sapidissima TaxID=34773 RepID=UPI001C084980|nr:syntaxin-binding protein 6 isoform X1 [Alosa sapidissima]XP_041943234.1 syntaxin-binding protein 6 isoform X1 [Alosa sapidissima]